MLMALTLHLQVVMKCGCKVKLFLTLLQLTCQKAKKSCLFVRSRTANRRTFVTENPSCFSSACLALFFLQPCTAATISLTLIKYVPKIVKPSLHASCNISHPLFLMSCFFPPLVLFAQVRLNPSFFAGNGICS